MCSGRQEHPSDKKPREWESWAVASNWVRCQMQEGEEAREGSWPEAQGQEDLAPVRWLWE